MKIADHMTYIVVCSHKGDSYLPERDVADTDRKTTVADIASGELSDVIQIIEFNPAEHSSRDVTEDIAWEVSAIWREGGEPLSDWRRDFVEQHCGMVAARAFPRAA